MIQAAIRGLWQNTVFAPHSFVTSTKQQEHLKRSSAQQKWIISVDRLATLTPSSADADVCVCLNDKTLGRCAVIHLGARKRLLRNHSEPSLCGADGGTLSQTRHRSRSNVQWPRAANTETRCRRETNNRWQRTNIGHVGRLFYNNVAKRGNLPFYSTSSPSTKKYILLSV